MCQMLRTRIHLQWFLVKNKEWGIRYCGTNLLMPDLTAIKGIFLRIDFFDNHYFFCINFFLVFQGMIFLSFFFFLDYKKEDKMPKGKLTESQKRSRARKSAITRCKNKCVESGGKKPKRNLTSSQRNAAKQRFLNNPKVQGWREFLASYMQVHKGEKDLMKNAGVAWRQSEERAELYSQ